MTANVHEFTEVLKIAEQIDDENLKAQLACLSRQFLFYKDAFLNGRDSDDAKRCKMCRNEPTDFIMLDLEEGL